MEKKILKFIISPQPRTSKSLHPSLLFIKLDQDGPPAGPHRDPSAAFHLIKPSWTGSPTISPCPQAAGTVTNKTENKLIVFQDGSYLELIAFIDDLPEHRKGHWWDKPFGIVDYAFTTQDDPDKQYAEMTKRLEGNALSVGFVEPRSGSRLREDGERISWSEYPSISCYAGLLPKIESQELGAIA